MNHVIVHAPATTANLGPGFDCLGMALDIWNQVRFEPGGQPLVTVEGQGAEQLSIGPENLAYQAALVYFREVGREAPAFSIACHNDIPLARGLGSSAAAIVAGLLGASALAGETAPDTERLLHLAAGMEGHPDNVTAALFGGCQIVVREDGNLLRAAVPIVREFHAVLFIPDVSMATAAARELLPTQVTRQDAVYNMSRVALLVNALATGDLASLRVATQDRLHQPAREKLLPAMPLVFRGALDAGALGVFLSGAGSTILALTEDRALTVSYEMADAADKAGLQGEIKVTKVSPQGAYTEQME